jgi:membrane dipeptidase
MLEHLARWNGFIASNGERVERIDSVERLRRAGSSPKVGVLLSYQDSVHFESADDVRLFHELGQRVSQLTYNGANALGCGAFVAEDGGLTAFGAEVVARMNAVGMAVDLSHCGDRTTLDAIAASARPVLVTHAACRALNPGYTRAKTDEAIRAVARGGGVIGIPTLRFMVRDREPVTPEHVLDHVEHVARLVGIEHVGIGTDTSLVTEDAEPLEVRRDRLTNAPPEYRTHSDESWLIGVAGLNHPLRTFDVVEGLIRRGYSDEEIRLVIGGSFARALEAIFTV